MRGDGLACAGDVGDEGDAGVAEAGDAVANRGAEHGGVERACLSDEVDPSEEAGVTVVGLGADVGQVEVGVGVDGGGHEDGVGPLDSTGVRGAGVGEDGVEFAHGEDSEGVRGLLDEDRGGIPGSGWGGIDGVGIADPLCEVEPERIFRLCGGLECAWRGHGCPITVVYCGGEGFCGVRVSPGSSIMRFPTGPCGSGSVQPK